MEKLPPIRFANGQHLNTTLTAGRSGVNQILFSDDSEHVKGRVSYNRSDDKAHFAGMLFRGAPRDYAAGRSIIAYFFETALPSLGLAPGETSIIRKASYRS